MNRWSSKVWRPILVVPELSHLEDKGPVQRTECRQSLLLIKSYEQVVEQSLEAHPHHTRAQPPGERRPRTEDRLPACGHSHSTSHRPLVWPWHISFLYAPFFLAIFVATCMIDWYFYWIWKTWMMWSLWFFAVDFTYLWAVLWIRIRNPGSGAFTPGSGIRNGFFRIPDTRSQSHIFESIVTIFWVKSSIILWKLAQIFFFSTSKLK